MVLLAKTSAAALKRGAYPSREGELQVIRAEGVVLDAHVDGLVQQIFVAVEVLRDTQPETEKLRCVSDVLQHMAEHSTYRRRADHMVVRHNTQLPPAIHHRQQGKVVVPHSL